MLPVAVTVVAPLKRQWAWPPVLPVGLRLASPFLGRGYSLLPCVPIAPLLAPNKVLVTGCGLCSLTSVSALLVLKPRHRAQTMLTLVSPAPTHSRGSQNVSSMNEWLR